MYYPHLLFAIGLSMVANDDLISLEMRVKG